MKKCLLLFACLLISVRAQAACTTAPSPCVQDAHGGGSTSTSTSFDIAVSTSQASGNMNHVEVIYCGDSACTSDVNAYTVSVTDDLGTTYSLLDNNGQTAVFGLQTFYGVLGSSGSNTIHVTVTLGTPVYYIQGEVSEWSGLTGTPLDKHAKNFGIGTSLSASTGSSTTSANELIIAAMMAVAPGGAQTAGAGYTLINSSTSYGEMTTVSSTGTQTATSTLASSSTWAMNIATFVCSSTCGGGPPPTNKTRFFLPLVGEWQ